MKKYYLLLLVFAGAVSAETFIGGWSYHLNRDKNYTEEHNCIGYESVKTRLSLTLCESNSYGETALYAAHRPVPYLIYGLASGYEEDNLPMLGDLLVFVGFIPYRFKVAKASIPIIFTPTGFHTLIVF